MKKTSSILKVLMLLILLIVGSFDYSIFATESNYEQINLLELEESKDFNEDKTIKTMQLNSNLRALSSFDITLTPNVDGFGSVALDWSDYDYRGKNFKAYKSSDGGRTYETIGIDYTLVDEVRCLQVYPDAGAGQMKNWVVNSGYGKGLITVDEVSITNFNRNPNAYLYKSNEMWNYDVVFFGTWDRNNCRDLSAASYNVVNEFIKSGKGVIFGHDTILCHSISSHDVYEYSGGAVKTGQGNFDKLAKTYFNILRYNSSSNVGGTQVQIVKKGLFTNYPNLIGTEGTKLNIPYCHTWGQYGINGYKNNIWLQYTSTNFNNPDNYYLMTYNNVASIQTGHSNGASTADEQKILANLIFYMNQLSYSTYRTIDSSAQDVANPNAPSVGLSGNTLRFSADDNGSTYYYYVESYSSTDTTAAGLLDRSVIKSTTVTTGVKSYRYIYDNNASTTVTLSNGTSTNSNINIDLNYNYLHVAAVDGAGNISDTTTIKLADMYTVQYNGNGATEGSTEDSKHILGVFQSLTPNGFEKKYTVTFDHNYEGSEDIEKVASYTFSGWNTKSNGKGTSYKEKEDVKNLGTKDGDIVQLYAIWKKQGITYKPTRPGYKFEGWYSDEECTKRVTKNEYVPTGDVTLYAKWKEVEYTTQYTIEYYYDNTRDNVKTERRDNVVSDNEVTQKVLANVKEGYNFQKVENCINDYNVIKIYYTSNSGSTPIDPENPDKPVV